MPKTVAIAHLNEIEDVDAPPGTLVFVRPHVTRTPFAGEPGTMFIRARASAPGDRNVHGMRSLAREDSDFDPLRDEPAFKELVGD